MSTGTSIYVENLLKHIQILDQMNEYVLFFDTEDVPAWLKDHPRFEVRCLSVPFVSLTPGKNFAAPLWLNLALPLVIWRQDIEVFFYSNSLSPLWNVCPSVIVVYDMSPYSLPAQGLKLSDFPLLQTNYFQFMLRLSVKNSVKIIVPSCHAKRTLVELLRVAPEKITVVSLGIDPTFRVIDDETLLAEARDRLRLGDHIILYVGNLAGRKNVVTLLEAFAILIQSHKFQHFQLVLRGDKDWFAEETCKAIEQLNLQDRVVIIGPLCTKELALLYNLADVFVFPSLYEGFGLPLIEAMACGVPAVASNCTSIPEVAGDSAILVEPRDIEGWVEAIKQVTTDGSVREKLVQKGLIRAKQFSWEQTTRGTIGVLQEAYGGRTRR